MATYEHKKLLKENITKTKQSKAKFIASKLKLSDRIEKHAEAHAYVTLKDHKENF